jgi:hypothetical protein
MRPLQTRQSLVRFSRNGAGRSGPRCALNLSLAWGPSRQKRAASTCFAKASRQNRVYPWSEIHDTLKELGRFLAETVAASSNPRAQYALDLWSKREERKTEQELNLTTGLAEKIRESFHDVDWQSNEIRAVARMSSRSVCFVFQKREKNLRFFDVTYSPPIPV